MVRGHCLQGHMPCRDSCENTYTDWSLKELCITCKTAYQLKLIMRMHEHP